MCVCVCVCYLAWFSSELWILPLFSTKLIFIVFLLSIYSHSSSGFLDSSLVVSNFCVHSGKAVPLSNILYAYIQTELFREHLCEGTLVFLISFLISKIMAICMALDNIIVSIHSHHCSWFLQRLLEIQVMCHQLQQHHHYCGHHCNNLHQLSFKDRGLEKIRNVPQVISLNQWKADTQRCTWSEKSTLFLYIKLLP